MAGDSRRRAGTVALTACVVVIVVVATVLVLPQWLYPERTRNELDELNLVGRARIEAQDRQLDAQNDVRLSIVQAIGGVAVLLGAGITWRQLRQSILDARQQRTTEQEIRWLDQYNKAATQLGNNNPSVRTAAVFSLQMLAESSLAYRRAIAETLTAFVRTLSPWPPGDTRAYASTALDDLVELRTYAPEVQAAITVLGQHTYRWYSPEHLRFRATDLRRVNAAGLHLERASLTGAHLEGAWMPEVRLDGASLRDAHLSGADLSRAVLHRANIRGADLTGATLDQVVLTEAIFDLTTRWPDGFTAEQALAMGAREVPVDAPPTSGGPVEVAAI